MRTLRTHAGPMGRGCPSAALVPPIGSPATWRQPAPSAVRAHLRCQRSEFPSTHPRRVKALPSSDCCQPLASQPHPAGVSAQSRDNLNRTVCRSLSLTHCLASSYPNVQDGWDPLSARTAGRERPPRIRPSLTQPGLSGRSLPRSFLAGRPSDPDRHRMVFFRHPDRQAWSLEDASSRRHPPI